MAPSPAAVGTGAGVEAAAMESGRADARASESHSGAPSAMPAGIRNQLLVLGLYLVAPIVLYYSLHSAGVGNVVAMSVGTIPPGVVVAVKVGRERKVDRLAVIVVTTLLVSIAVSFIGGSPRFLLAKDGWLMGLWGLWFLLSTTDDEAANCCGFDGAPRRSCVGLVAGVIVALLLGRRQKAPAPAVNTGRSTGVVTRPEVARQVSRPLVRIIPRRHASQAVSAYS